MYDTQIQTPTLSCRRTFTGAAIADVAKRFIGVHGERGGRMSTPDEGLDSAGLIELVADHVGDPIRIDRDFHDCGGSLRLVQIPLADAAAGDVLQFDFTDAPSGSALRHQLAILTQGTVDHDRAKIACVPHAVSTCWLQGLWRDHLVRAYRFSARREG